jgi:N-acetylneuraminic acid mutarotase
VPLGLLLGWCALGCDGAAVSAGPHNVWESLDDMPGTPRMYVGVAAISQRVFVVGAFGSGPESRDVAAFDTRTKKWETLEPLPSSFQMPNVAAVGNRLFVLGAVDVVTTLEYDAAKNSWVPRAPVPVARGRGQSAIGVWGTKILLAGGVIPGKSANLLNTGMRVPEVLAYDTSNDSWEKLPDLELTRGYAMGAVVGDQFWVMGGSTDFARTDDVTTLDLKSRTWMVRPPIPLTLSSAGVAVHGGHIYLIGGVATGTGMIGPTTLVLDPSSGMFKEAARMITPRFAMGAAAVGPRIYVPAGIAAAGDGTMFQAVSKLEAFVP